MNCPTHDLPMDRTIDIAGDIPGRQMARLCPLCRAGFMAKRRASFDLWRAQFHEMVERLTAEIAAS